jgi:hypothetical protein
VAEVVEDDCFMSTFKEQTGDGSTHISGSASDQYLHDLFPFPDRFSIKLSLLHRVRAAICAPAASAGLAAWQCEKPLRFFSEKNFDLREAGAEENI